MGYGSLCGAGRAGNDWGVVYPNNQLRQLLGEGAPNNQLRQTFGEGVPQ